MAATTAGNIITVVRDQIPDPVYAVSTSGGVSVGDALPQVDGNLFRSQSLLRWVDEAVKQVAKEAGYLIDDWIPVAVSANQPFYAVDGKWVTIFSAWFKEQPLTFLEVESQLGPFQLRGTNAFAWGYWRKADVLQVSLLPIPNVSDQVTSCRGTMATTDTIVNLTDAVSFNSYGWVSVSSANGLEILAYQSVSGSASPASNMLYQVARGQCGTNQISHASGDAVTHLGFVMKGIRMPIDVTSVSGANGVIELPSAFVYAVQLYVLWKVREAENDQQGAQFQYTLWHQEMDKIKASAYWRQKQGMQVQPYGQSNYSGLAYGFVIRR